MNLLVYRNSVQNYESYQVNILTSPGTDTTIQTQTSSRPFLHSIIMINLFQNIQSLENSILDKRILTYSRLLDILH